MLSPLRKRAGSRLREPFGKAGLTVAVIALVFAMLGGAYAASGLNSKQKKEVKAIARGFQGSGPAGTAGPQGAAGANGKDGSSGSNGKDGANGKSVTVSASSCGGLGGALVKQEGAASGVEVCNGEEGEEGEKGDKGDKGEEGSPWTAGGTLPEGQTETGAFSVSTFASEPSESVFAPKFAYAPISFPIPLPVPNGSASFGAANVHFIVGAGTPECPGIAALPTAVPGNLCVYATATPTGYTLNGIKPVKRGSITGFGALSTGADLVFNVTAPGEGFAGGTYAVTAFETPVITEVTPNQGPAAGGTAVTIKGEGFTSASAVKFGSESATGAITVSPDGKEITGLSSPAGTGTVDVTVTNPAGTSKAVAADKYTYE